ncbi:zeaxanthin epoxidase chloroplastic-like [Trifolium pratense]|uniref:Zeaxanthin epoxidase chloroplastic-like n=1 Tax=Trifolium pratense TaxID=57577 RepID=A0A2K3NKH9_TRIPR|nr:zeaxanthin epoxidase chloroplastic-like [Trifolium pratense]
MQSNVLAALETIDFKVAEEVMRVGCIADDKINGLVDEVSGSIYHVDIESSEMVVWICGAVVGFNSRQLETVWKWGFDDAERQWRVYAVIDRV